MGSKWREGNLIFVFGDCEALREPEFWGRNFVGWQVVMQGDGCDKAPELAQKPSGPTYHLLR